MLDVLGHARAFAADADFREYLPVEAGGGCVKAGAERAERAERVERVMR